MRHVLTALLCGILATTAAGQPSEAAAPRADSRVDWWREARFGMFIHWGLYAIPAGEWNGNTNHAEWIRHTAQIPVEEYDKLAEKFNPQRFDARQWVRMAKQAGMKYIVITSKHHDGFALFDSSVSEFDVAATPFRRDILKELADACAADGVRLCFYHSIMDWHHPDYLPRRPWEAATRSADGADFDRYATYMKAQLRELLTRYGPIGVLWFDGEWEDTWTHERGVDLYQFVRGLQPDIIINNRVDKGREGMAGLTRDGGFVGDFGTPEQEVPAAGLPGVDWESCLTMNGNWGYNRADKNFKTTAELIRTLCDIASKGGNLLLNIGPTAEGEFPAESVQRLAEIGAWMDRHGEAIYGTQAGPIGLPAWGRCTQRALPGGGHAVYLHVFDWPSDRMLHLSGFASDPTAARCLSDASAGVSVSRQDDALRIELPPRAVDPNVTVMRLDFAAPPEVIAEPLLLAESEQFLDQASVGVRTPAVRAEVRWTTDGSAPTAQSSTGATIVLRVSATVAARVFRDGRPLSGVARRTFEKVTPRKPDATSDRTAGVKFSYYEGHWDRLPDFSTLTPIASGVAGNIERSMRRRAEGYGLQFRGFVRVPQTGMYEFSLRSDDGSRLWVGDRLVVDNDGAHTVIEKSGRVALEEGLHALRVEYFNRTGEETLDVWISGPDVRRQRLPSDALIVGY